MADAFRMIAHRLMARSSAPGEPEVWHDAPEHFGRFYPATLSLPDGRVDGSAEGAWFADQLRNILARPVVEYRVGVRKPERPRQRCIISNCLDPVYGHALYKLAAARALVGKYPDADVFVVVSQALAQNAAFAAGAIVVEENLGVFKASSGNLMAVIEEATSAYGERAWAFSNGTRVGDQAELPMPPGIAPAPRANRVMFLHRDDRTWGMGPRHQLSNVNRVFRALKRRFPGTRTCVIGVGRSDRRYACDETSLVDRPSDSYEAKLLEWSQEALCVIAVHGSHLLVPSYLAVNTVELMPLERLGNFGQAYWPNPSRHMLDVLFTYRVLYGRWRLLTLTPRTVIDVASSLIEQQGSRQSRYQDETRLAAF